MVGILTVYKTGTSQLRFDVKRMEEAVIAENKLDTQYWIGKTDRADGVAPETKVTDGFRWKIAYSIDAILDAQVLAATSWHSGTSYTAHEAKAYFFKEILLVTGDLFMEYRDYADSDYGTKDRSGALLSTVYVKIILDKATFTDTVARADIDGGGVLRYDVQLQFIRGSYR